MKSFTLANPTTLEQAVALLARRAERGARGRVQVLAGGQDLLTEMKEHLAEPELLVNLKGVGGLSGIELDGSGGLAIGALATIAALEEHEGIRARFRVLAEAASSIASPQIRSVGTVGGNLCQRPRCWYYRSEHAKCLKKGGSECFSYSGLNKYNAILGGGPSYIVHPSDLAPALVALDGEVLLRGGSGERALPLEKFFTLPSEGSVLRENVLADDEILARVRVPPLAAGTRSTYLKFKERGSFDFALASVALSLALDGGKVTRARVVLGGVAPIPWRSKDAESALVGKALDEEAFKAAGEAAVRGAEPLDHNAYKVPLVKGLVFRALQVAVARLIVASMDPRPDPVQPTEAGSVGPDAAAPPFRTSPFCGRLRGKKSYFLHAPPMEADDLLDGSSHCWCARTMQALGPDDDPASPEACRAGRVCFEPILWAWIPPPHPKAAQRRDPSGAAGREVSDDPQPDPAAPRRTRRGAPTPAPLDAGALVSGRCFEARSASVFAGACHYGGEATTAGREAVVVWHVESGVHAGVDLAGVSAAAAIAADANLAEPGAERRSVLYVSADSTAEERRAVLDLLRTRYAAVLGKVLEVRTEALEVAVDGDRYVARAGNRFRIEGAALPDRACCKMPVNVWYRPLVALERPIVGHNAVASLSDERLGPGWTRFDENTGFVGSFVLRAVEADRE